MKIICYYNKNLKMSEGKLAAQVGHVCKELGKVLWYQFQDPPRREDTIVVLGLRQNKFKEKFSEVQNESFFYAQRDLGLTEVDANTITAFGYIEQVRKEYKYYLPIWGKDGKKIVEFKETTKEKADQYSEKVVQDKNYKIYEEKEGSKSVPFITDEIGQFAFPRKDTGLGWTCVPSIIKTKYDGNEN
jgi:hypothetical protein